MRASSQMSATSGTTSISGRVRRISPSISKSANSARSTSRIFAGWKRATCRTSSEPIEPPAPVTMTRLPARNWPSCASSRYTGSRPSRSSIWTLRMRVTCTLPWSTS